MRVNCAESAAKARAVGTPVGTSERRSSSGLRSLDAEHLHGAGVAALAGWLSRRSSRSGRHSARRVARRLCLRSAVMYRLLLTRAFMRAQDRDHCGQRWDWLEIREYLVLKYEGMIERFPVLEGDAAQARLRAALCQHPGDCVVVVTEDDAHIRVRSESPVENGPSPTPL
jgi:hypothetical protein